MAIPAYPQPALQVLVSRFLLPACSNKVSAKPIGSPQIYLYTLSVSQQQFIKLY